MTSGAAPAPRAVVEGWVEAFNRADADALAALYHEDAVNHQVAAGAPVEGREAIRVMFAREFAGAEMTCIPENLFQDGEWAILEWRDPLGMRGCGFFHVEDGLIRFQRGYWDRLSLERLRREATTTPPSRSSAGAAKDPVVRPARLADAAEWVRMRQALWPSDSDEHEREIAAYFRGEARLLAEALLAFDAEGRAAGFAELSIRPYAEECYSGRVGFLEGWYVDEDCRRRGLGAALVEAAEEWARAQGCTEFASDAAAENAVSRAAHLALGFTETGTIVGFRKDL